MYNWGDVPEGWEGMNAFVPLAVKDSDDNGEKCLGRK
jgi:hypothetical protein